MLKRWNSHRIVNDWLTDDILYLTHTPRTAVSSLLTILHNKALIHSVLHHHCPRHHLYHNSHSYLIPSIYKYTRYLNSTARIHGTEYALYTAHSICISAVSLLAGESIILAVSQINVIKKKLTHLHGGYKNKLRYDYLRI